VPPPFNQGYSNYQIALPPFTRIVKVLVISNVAIHLLQFIGGAEAISLIQGLFALDPERVLKGLWIWQPLTYQFLHNPSDIWHLLFNMLMLWFFGGDLSQRWGDGAFLRFYLVCGTGAGIFTVIVNAILGVQNPTIGASGAIFGLLVAFGMTYPNRTILFMMLFPIPAKVFVAIFAVLQLYFAGSFRSGGGVAYFAHLGGMLVAWLYLHGWVDPKRLYAEVKWRMRRRRFRSLDGKKDPFDDDRYNYH
jgi:membrane associated rhomboid family serine protease